MANPTPGIPITEAIEYTLLYRDRKIPQKLNFKFTGTWDDAKECAREYCKKKNYDFVYISYMFQRIDKFIAEPKVENTDHIVRGIGWTPEAKTA